MLPLAWSDEIFARLAVRYGAAWLSMWHGIDIAAVKADWCRELGGFAGNTGAIAYALEHLPADRPPNVAQFKALCINRPQTFVALPEPKADPERVAAAMAQLNRPREGRPLSLAAQCIENIDAAATRNRLTPAQREMRAACQRKVDAERSAA